MLEAPGTPATIDRPQTSSTIVSRGKTTIRRWQSFDAARLAPGPIHVRHDRPGRPKQVFWADESGQPGLGDHRVEDLVYVPRWPLPSFVVVTEGEKAADAVRAAGIPAVGTVCGASSTPGPAVVRLFTGVHATLWSDSGRLGFDHMARFARLLEPVVRSMALVDVPAGVAEGWDAADADPQSRRALVATAHAVWLQR